MWGPGPQEDPEVTLEGLFLLGLQKLPKQSDVGTPIGSSSVWSPSSLVDAPDEYDKEYSPIPDCSEEIRLGDQQHEGPREHISIRIVHSFF